MNDPEPIMLVFPRLEVEAMNFRPFLRRFGADRLPSGPELAALMGRFNFFVHGYDDHPDELYAIPEVRKFYRRFLEIWPYWFYFCDLRCEALLMMTLCCIDRLSGTKRDGTPLANVAIDPLDVLRFVAAGFAPMNLMFERAGASEMAIYERTRDIMAYFDLPFDEPPPDLVAN